MTIMGEKRLSKYKTQSITKYKIQNIKKIADVDFSNGLSVDLPRVEMK